MGRAGGGKSRYTLIIQQTPGTERDSKIFSEPRFRMHGKHGRGADKSPQDVEFSYKGKEGGKKGGLETTPCVDIRGWPGGGRSETTASLAFGREGKLESEGMWSWMGKLSSARWTPHA